MEKYEKMKEDIRMMKSSDGLNKEEDKKIKTTKNMNENSIKLK